MKVIATAIVIGMVLAMLHAFSRGVGYEFAHMLFHHHRY